tara:strand:+ start:6394 stop:6840 length:447 start_codon:yes stop_codon:yes gene_type:complete
MYFVKKTYGHERGLSCCFRQWKAISHCRLLHGYSLSFAFMFRCNDLDDRHWVYDFGGLGWLKDFLSEHFDHTMVIAADDPELESLSTLQDKGLCRLLILPAVGCEKFAEFVYKFAAPKVYSETAGRTRLMNVEVREHGSNSAIFSELD